MSLPLAMDDDSLTLGQCVALACLLEATAPKPGNVHRGADFEDLTFDDLAAAGIAIAPCMDEAANRPLGQTILQAVRATQKLVATNANLGIILLVAPLAKVPRSRNLCDGVADVLSQLTSADATDVYQAIREANPGGLGQTETADIAGEPPTNLLDAMSQAAERDLVARQYANNFQEVFNKVLPQLLAGLGRGWSLNDAIVRVHLQIMSEYPDSLIGRKLGAAVARQSADHAAEVLAAGEPGSETYNQALADFDFWLRCDGHRRNPGTTADLIAAGLFAGLRDGLIDVGATTR